MSDDEDDIVERLRSPEVFLTDGMWISPVACVAATEIERLREALRRIAHAPHGKVFCRDGHEEAYLIARTALGEDR